MHNEEEKIRNVLKITIFFLITMLGTTVLDPNIVIVLLLFHIAFVKD